MIVVDIKVPATLARLVALWLILVGIGAKSFGIATARAETADAAPDTVADGDPGRLNLRP